MHASNEEEVFTPDRFAEMKEELIFLNRKMIELPLYFKEEIIISYLKDHCIKNEWIKANPELVKFLLSGNFNSRQTEFLFDYCRFKPEFRRDFEKYMKKALLN